jgi:hypothetical protein
MPKNTSMNVPKITAGSGELGGGAAEAGNAMTIDVRAAIVATMNRIIGLYTD